MLKKNLLFLILSLLAGQLYSQNTEITKPHSFGLSFGIAQYDGDLGSEVGKFTRKQSYQFSAVYGYMLTKQLQLQLDLNHSSLNYQYRSWRDRPFRRPPNEYNEFESTLVNLSALLRFHAKKNLQINAAVFTPFVESGAFLTQINTTSQNAYLSGGLLGGLGFETPLNNDSKLFINARYHWLQFGNNRDALESNVPTLKLDQADQDEFLHFSIGVRRAFGRKKTAKPKTNFSPAVINDQLYATNNIATIDSDGDSIVDELDLCPELAGSKTASGCPDQDQDGFADAVDECPAYTGSNPNGCPDIDQDSVYDFEDQCPEIQGIPYLEGCNAYTFYFESDSNQLKPNDLTVIKQLVNELAQRAYHIVLQGYTDPTGPTKYNEQLGLNRAYSIQKIFIELGIPMQHISIQSFGELKPINGGIKKADQALSRRVEMLIELK